MVMVHSVSSPESHGVTYGHHLIPMVQIVFM